jgi:hypothetical protein
MVQHIAVILEMKVVVPGHSCKLYTGFCPKKNYTGWQMLISPLIVEITKWKLKQSFAHKQWCLLVNPQEHSPVV